MTQSLIFSSFLTFQTFCFEKKDGRSVFGVKVGPTTEKGFICDIKYSNKFNFWLLYFLKTMRME